MKIPEYVPKTALPTKYPYLSKNNVTLWLKCYILDTKKLYWNWYAKKKILLKSGIELSHYNKRMRGRDYKIYAPEYKVCLNRVMLNR